MSEPVPFEHGQDGRYLEGVKLYAHESFEYRRLELHAYANIVNYQNGGRTEGSAVAAPIQWLEVDPHDPARHPAFLSISSRMAGGDYRNAVMELVDQLIRAGVIPKAESLRGDVLGATQAHLAQISGILDRVLPLALRKAEE
jgi:hypothetical protein